MAIQTSAGSKLSIAASGSPATYDAAGFAALTWKEIGEVVDIGEFGKEFNLVNHNPISTRQTKKLKGSYNNGSIQLQMARDSDAASNQAELRTALDSDASYPFSVELQDGTKMYFTGKVMSYRTQVGGVDSVTGATTTIEIDDDIIEVDPT